MLSVIIPHFNQPDLLDRCLTALMPQARGAEVIVVDNGSTTMPEAVVARHPGVRLARETTQGPGPARNHGVALSSGDLLAFLDADCVADPGWIAAIRTGLADPAVQVIGGDVQIHYADPSRPAAIECFEAEFG